MVRRRGWLHNGPVEIALILVGIAVVVLAGEALSERFNIPAPLLLIAVGAAASYVPVIPEIHLEPEVVLLGLLPPLLYTAAIQTSLVDFTAQRQPILLLSVGLVVVTTFAVGAVVNWLIPDLGWPASLAIGAVVAPPDAVAATAIARRIGLPRSVVTVLEGESLLNDATALVALRTAIAAIAGAVSIGEIGLDFLIAAGGGTAAGFIVFAVVAWLRRRVDTPVIDTTISLITPFAAYMLAETVHASGVIAVVIAGLLLGHKAPIIQNAPSRIAERTTWSAISFLLENAVFLLIGLQTRSIVDAVVASHLPVGWIIGVCVAVLATVIVVRLVWVYLLRGFLVLNPRRQAGSAANSFLVGWAGMRGVVTLAAAFIIPIDVPHREILLLIALTVVAGTLFLQGLTLPWLTRRLDVETPDPATDALTRAVLLEDAGRAGLERLGEIEFDDPHHVLDLIRKRIDERSFAAWERLSTAGDRESPSELYGRVRRQMLEAEREKVLEVRGSGSVPGDIVAEVLQMLDVEESMIDTRAERAQALRSAGLRMAQAQDCPDLASHPALPDAEATECPDCVREGTDWVALRRCLDCGNVGCCDSSPGRHATKHFRVSNHPVMESAEPGEAWRWCYVHHTTG